MEEFTQITINDWLEMKEKLKRELMNVRHSFVRLGFLLRTIDDQKLYENDGYKSITEFAQIAYGLQPSTTSRFMKINREYSVDGYSEILKPEYEEFGRSQLEEMLQLTDSDREMIEPNTPRDAIRELKKFNKEQPVEGPTELVATIIEFLKENKEVTKEIRQMINSEGYYIDKIKEIMIPSGNRTYKKGIIFLMMYEDKVTFKKFGGKVENLTWDEFGKNIMDAFDSIEEVEGIEEVQAEQETQIIEFPKKMKTDDDHIEKEKIEEKPVDIVRKNQIEEENIQREKEEKDDKNIEEEKVEKTAETLNVETVAPAQKKEEKPIKKEEKPSEKKIEKPVIEIEITRKQFLNSLNEHEAAVYLSDKLKIDIEKIESFLKEKVNEKGCPSSEY